MHARLAEAMDYVEQKRKELLESLAEVPDDALRRRAVPNRWSVAEIIEHLRLVESGVARLITKRVRQARDAGVGEERSTESVMPSFDSYRARLESVVLQSPEGVRPRSDVDYNEALAGLGLTRQALRDAAASANGIALSEIKHTHPILGELDLYQWLIFLGQHEERHRKQIERTLQSLSK
jgi:DinB superfamily